MISYFRVDERVVHGQTTVHLSKQYPLDGILIVDDDIANDPFMLNIYKNVIPNDKVRVLGFTVEKAVTKLPEAEKSAKSYYVVCKRPTTVKRLMEAGYEIKKSRQSWAAGRKTRHRQLRGYAQPAAGRDRGARLCRSAWRQGDLQSEAFYPESNVERGQQGL